MDSSCTLDRSLLYLDSRLWINRHSNGLDWLIFLFYEILSMFYLLIRYTWKVELEGFKNNCLLETQDMWPFLAGRFPFCIYDPLWSTIQCTTREVWGKPKGWKLQEGTWLSCKQQKTRSVLRWPAAKLGLAWHSLVSTETFTHGCRLWLACICHDSCDPQVPL